MSPEELRSSWNKIAVMYQSTRFPLVNDVSYGRLAPPERSLNLLGNVAGKRILDLGCGGGQNCVALAKMGAICTGVDFSDEQVRWAQITAEQENVLVDFVRADALEYLLRSADGTFDIVLCIHCLQYHSDLGAIYRQLRRILTNSGVLIISTNHPFRDVAEVDSGTAVIRRSYFESGEDAWHWKGIDREPVAPLVTYRRTLSELLNPLLDAGFVVDRVLEPEPCGDFEFEEDEMTLYSQIPSTLIVKAVAEKSN